jgi:hypothetical protein
MPGGPAPNKRTLTVSFCTAASANKFGPAQPALILCHSPKIDSYLLDLAGEL